MKLPDIVTAHCSPLVLPLALILSLALLAGNAAQKFETRDPSAAREKSTPNSVRLVEVNNVPASATITSTSPSQGPIAGGTQVTLTGLGFTGTTLLLDYA